MKNVILGAKKDLHILTSEPNTVFEDSTFKAGRSFRIYNVSGSIKIDTCDIITTEIVPEITTAVVEYGIVINCTTLATIARYIKTGMPLVRRRITIDGNIVGKPQNVMVAVGASLSEIVSFADLKKEPDRIILGGPMMGSCAFDLDYPISKTNNAVLLFADTPVYEPSACIRCGRCVRACSMNLLPTELEHAFDAGDVKKLSDLKVHLCVNCGACSYVCPAKRNIAEKNQLAKNFVREQLQKMKKE